MAIIAGAPCRGRRPAALASDQFVLTATRRSSVPCTLGSRTRCLSLPASYSRNTLMTLTCPSSSRSSAASAARTALKRAWRLCLTARRKDGWPSLSSDRIGSPVAFSTVDDTPRPSSSPRRCSSYGKSSCQNSTWLVIADLKVFLYRQELLVQLQVDFKH